MPASARLSPVRINTSTLSAASAKSWASPGSNSAGDAKKRFSHSVAGSGAEVIVAAKGADLKTYGLEKPEIRWKIVNGEKEVLNLLIGAPEKDGRRYAKLGQGDQVFLLNAKQSESALAEYRSRKPWASLDSAQIEQIVYAGATSFTLKKKDTTWSVQEKPDAKINAKTVTDTLDALAGLKVDRYIADAKGELQLYGLQTPTWKIEINAGGSPRTLLIGRAEGSSQRLYATVAGTDVVFVLSADDSRRIARPLAEFLETSAK